MGALITAAIKEAGELFQVCKASLLKLVPYLQQCFADGTQTFKCILQNM